MTEARLVHYSATPRGGYQKKISSRSVWACQVIGQSNQMMEESMGGWGGVFYVISRSQNLLSHLGNTHCAHNRFRIQNKFRQTETRIGL